MKTFISLSLILSLFTSIMTLNSEAIALTPEHDQYLPDYTEQRKQIAQGVIHYMHSLFWTKYAPHKWKKKRYGWDLDKEFEDSLERLNHLENWSAKTLKPLFSRFVNSCQDVHTYIRYEDPHIAYIPLEVDLVEDRVIVTESSVAGICSGDEILSINNQNPLDHLKQEFYGSSDVIEARPYFLIDHLFQRHGSFISVPKDGQAITLQIKGKKGIYKLSLNWFVTCFHGFSSPYDSYGANAQTKLSQESLQAPQTCLKSHLVRKDPLLRPFVGSCEQKTALIKAYHEKYPLHKQAGYDTYSEPLNWSLIHENGVDVGYLNIKEFQDLDFTQIDMALKILEKKSRCLVLDLRDNPGGLDFIMYALAMRMIDRPLVNLMNSCMLDEGIVEMHRHWLTEYNDMLEEARSDSDIASWTQDYGIPCTLDFVRSLRTESLTCIEEWENGYTCTRFFPMRGLKTLEPHPHIRYTKPLFILVNERCASCADIFPTLMKDNKRALILGRTTSGAGGTVESFPVANAFGIAEISLTTSLILRNNYLVLEDNGLSPDFEHKKTVESVTDRDQEKMQAIRFAAQNYSKLSP